MESALAIGIPARAAADEPTAVATSFGATFRDGFFLESADGDHRLRIGGIAQADGRWFPGNTSPGPVDNFLVRTARLEIEGTVWRYFDLKFLPDFAGGRVFLQEAWVEARIAPWLRLRAGKQKVPFGLERLIPEGRTAFMERGFPTQIAPNRDIGLTLSGEVAGGVMQYAVGVYNGVADNSTVDFETDSDKEEAARLFFHPLRPTGLDALRYLGIGGAFTFTRLRGATGNPGLPVLQTEGLTPFFSYLAGPAQTLTDSALAGGTRLRATVHGCYYFRRVGVLGEYLWNSQEVRHGAEQAAVVAEAWQGYATLLLTADTAAYAGVKPSRPFDLRAGRRGAGAWEVGFRYSGIRIGAVAFDRGFADPDVSPRGAHSYTVGLNWYPNSNTKMQIDFVHTDFTGGGRASENAMMGRLQYQL